MRMRQHSCKKTGSWNVCHWLSVRRNGRDGTRLLRALESRMIEALAPPCNKRRPGALSGINYPPRNEQEALYFTTDKSDVRIGINAALTEKARRNLKVLCAAWRMSQGEVISQLLEQHDVRQTVERLR